MLSNLWKGLIETNLETYLPTKSYYIELGTGTSAESAADTDLAQPSIEGGNRRIAGAGDGGSETLDTVADDLECIFWIPSTIWNNLLSTQNNSTVTTTADGSIGAATHFAAQKIVLPYTANVPQIKVYIKNDGGAPSDLTIEIQTDTAGKPSGTAVTNGTTTIASADIGAAYAEETATFSTAPSLTGGTSYWVVLKCTAGTAGDYLWNYDDGNTIGLSGFALTTDGGTNWTVTAADTSYVKVYINKFKEVAVFDAITGGNLISRNLLTTALTKDSTYEYQISLTQAYEIVIN